MERRASRLRRPAEVSPCHVGAAIIADALGRAAVSSAQSGACRGRILRLIRRDDGEKLLVERTVGGQDLQLGTWYLNPSADSFKVSRFYYYISNIVLVALKYRALLNTVMYDGFESPVPVLISAARRGLVPS